jgi:exodeoxyribonuclease V alpha subunit
VPEKILIEQAKTVCQELSVPLERMVESALYKGTFVPAESGYQLVGSAIQEASVAKFLAQCASRETGADSFFATWEFSLTDDVIEHALCDFEQSLPFAMTAEQRAAVSGVVRSNVAVISGGAGTGKTTILLAALALYEAVSTSMPILLVALSGRSAHGRGNRS